MFLSKLLFKIIEEQKHKFELQEKSINALKHEYESQIVSLKKEQNSRLQEGKLHSCTSLKNV